MWKAWKLALNIDYPLCVPRGDNYPGPSLHRSSQSDAQLAAHGLREPKQGTRHEPQAKVSIDPVSTNFNVGISTLKVIDLLQPGWSLIRKGHQATWGRVSVHACDTSSRRIWCSQYKYLHTI